jgi:hypothetical protein
VLQPALPAPQQAAVQVAHEDDRLRALHMLGALSAPTPLGLSD